MPKYVKTPATYPMKILKNLHRLEVGEFFAAAYVKGRQHILSAAAQSSLIRIGRTSARHYQGSQFWEFTGAKPCDLAEEEQRVLN